MAEEIKLVDSNPEGSKPEPTLTPIETKAQEQGWVPQDEWAGEPDQWRPAKEFLDRGELFKKIDEQNRTIKEFKRTLDQFSQHHDRVKKVEYERAKADLLVKKKEALNEGDADAVVDIDEKLALVREAQQRPSQNTPSVQEVNPVFVAWTERNSWYNNNDVMKVYADKVGNDLGARGDMSATDILAEVEKKIKQKFPEKFQNPRRNEPGTVEGSTTKSGKAGKGSFELSAEERQVMQRFVRTIPGYTEEKYITELKRVKGV